MGDTVAGTPAPEKTIVEERGGGIPIRQNLKFEGALSPEADLDKNAGTSVSSQYYRASYNIIVPLSRTWFVRGGAGWAGLYYDFDATDRYPDQLHRISLDIGVGTKLSDQWTAIVSASPGIYSDLEDVSGDDFDTVYLAALQWKPVERLEIFAGARYSTTDKVPVLPLAGLKWTINDSWSIDAMYPQPVVRYTASDWMELYAGMDIRGSNYRTSKSFKGTTPDGKSLANEWLGVSELAAIGGVTFKLSTSTALDLGAGYIFRRKFDYDDVDFSESADEGALTVQAGVRVKF
jgi:opacity protein-like surface antigen